MIELTEKAGFGYSFLNPKLKDHLHQNAGQFEFDEFSGKIKDFYQPLVNQPGEKFEYGVSKLFLQSIYRHLGFMR